VEKETTKSAMAPYWGCPHLLKYSPHLLKYSWPLVSLLPGFCSSVVLPIALYIPCTWEEKGTYTQVNLGPRPKLQHKDRSPCQAQTVVEYDITQGPTTSRETSYSPGVISVVLTLWDRDSLLSCARWEMRGFISSHRAELQKWIYVSQGI